MCGDTMVTLMVTAAEPFGTPQLPWIWNARGRVPGQVRAGPPSVPVAFRVSTTRHGVREWYWKGPAARAVPGKDAAIVATSPSRTRTVHGARIPPRAVGREMLGRVN